MRNEVSMLRRHLSRQIAHWGIAGTRLADIESLAAPQAWRSLERYTGQRLRAQFTDAVKALEHDGQALLAAVRSASSQTELLQLSKKVRAFKSRYLRIETALDFYADAINSRTNPEMGALLRSCDALVDRAMKDVLVPLGKPVPPVVTFADQGRGALILQYALRLWDPAIQSYVAAIKITRHALHNGTSLIHEAGHQISAIIGWNDELRDALTSELQPTGLGDCWGAWASEIAADAFAFVFTGYASVCALHDVVADEPRSVFRYAPDDPHPISFLRVLLGVEMCRHTYGAGPWDELADVWQLTYPIHPSLAVGDLLHSSQRVLPRIAEVVLTRPYRAFAGQSLINLVNPQKVSPTALQQLEETVGPALFLSSYWVTKDPMRLLALTGLKSAVSGAPTAQSLRQQQSWMLRLGDSLAAA